MKHKKSMDTKKKQENERYADLKGHEHQGTSAQLVKLRTESKKVLGGTILNRAPSDWWNELWTSSNR